MLPISIALLSLLCYCAYFLMLWLVRISSSQQIFTRQGNLALYPGKLVALQLAGILWLGLVPLIWAEPILPIILGTTRAGNSFNFLFIILLGVLVAVGSREGQRYKITSFNSSYVLSSLYARYAVFRIPFLISYELFFRGHLLFFNMDSMGLVPAILTDMILNVILHIFNGRKSMLGCILFSLIACLLNIVVHAVWPSILLHLAFSFSFERSVLSKFSHPVKSVI